jgi:hypothetical protein
MIYVAQLRFLFFNSLITGVGLKYNTRAVARIPLAFLALSMIYCFTSDDCPA